MFKNVVAGNNLYDAEYIRYFTGINATVLPSICSYTKVVYRPTKRNREYIFIPTHKHINFNEQFLNELKLSIEKFNTSIIVKPLRQLYKFYRYINLVRHPAIIYLPYQALTGVGKNSSTIPSYYVNSTIPDPNNEYDYSAIRYWLKFADFYQWPHITYFNSTDDLTLKLINTNLTFISEQMSIYNNQKKT
ncbi:unnamed protein product [Rotaria sp. Silwood1]|nr:unnamed protein product [Rotaria sp. Silwood1]CAF5010377.1 unnamed protein product [Rotaria sp. Silwood1]